MKYNKLNEYIFSRKEILKKLKLKGEIDSIVYDTWQQEIRIITKN